VSQTGDVQLKVSEGLGWPCDVTNDPRIGWPNVPRETLTWSTESRGPWEASYQSGDQRTLRENETTPVDGDNRLAGPQPVSELTVAVSPILSGSVAGPLGTSPSGDGSLEPVRPNLLTEPPAAAPEEAAPALGSLNQPNLNQTNPASRSMSRLEVATPERLRESGLTSAEPAFRPVGPRRARFDEEEFAVPVTETPTPVSVVSRETAAKGSRLPAPPATRIFVVANQKGGVGKTTTSVNLAAALAMGGLSVLLIDLDPQGNASTALGIEHPPGTSGTYEVLIAGSAIADLVVDSPEAAGLKVLPATVDLAGAEIELVSVVARENRLLRAVKAYLRDHPVDYVFFDCPPSLGLLTLNALVAANEILIPIQCEYYALEGVSQLMRTISLVKGELNDQLQVSTVLLTMYDARTRLAAQVADEVRTHFASETLPTVIPRSVRISEAPSYGQTVLTYHPDSAGAVSYLEAAHEIARRGAKEHR